MEKIITKKLLLTGGTGLIGKELPAYLKKLGFDIYAITIDENNPDCGVHWIKGNLFDENFIKNTMEDIKPLYLLNMAWVTTGNYLQSEINNSFLDAGVNLIKYFAQNGGKRAVYAGTCFEYKFKDEPLKENDELDPNKTLYTLTKDKLHKKAEAFAKENNISFGWGRIFYVYGKNEDKSRLTGMVTDKLKNNEEVIIKSGSLKKDYMYTKDIAGAFAKFLNSNVEGAVNICTGNPVSIKDYVLAMAREVNKEELIIFKDEPSNQPPVIAGDNSRLLNEVGYEIEYDLYTAIKEILSA